jgi:hypothetical protein
MTRKLVLIALLSASACNVQQAGNGAGNQAQPITPISSKPTSGEPDPSNGTAPSVPIPIPGRPGGPKAKPAPPPPPTPESEKSVSAAARVLERYFAAVATKRYADAYRMWGRNGEATGMSEPKFAASFAKYRIYDGNIGKPGDTEGAAGSIYITIPAKVTGVLAKGGGFVLEGPMTLRRVNDVDGSTAEQRRWHIASSGLKPRP